MEELYTALPNAVSFLSLQHWVMGSVYHMKGRAGTNLIGTLRYEILDIALVLAC